MTMLESLRVQAAASCAFLVEENGDILIASGDVADIPQDELGRLAVHSFALESAESRFIQCPLAQDYSLYATLVTDHLYLALVSLTGQDLKASAQIWQQVDIAAGQIRTALYHQIENGDTSENGNGTQSHKFIPLKGHRAGDLSEFSGPDAVEPDESAVNWAIISDSSNLLNRMENFCQLN